MQEQTELDIEAAMMSDEGDSKAAKFVKLANYRLEKAVLRIRQMRNLASSNYSYSPDQADFIVAALRKEADELEKRFFSIVEDEDIPQL